MADFFSGGGEDFGQFRCLRPIPVFLGYVRAPDDKFADRVWRHPQRFGPPFDRPVCNLHHFKSHLGKRAAHANPASSGSAFAGLRAKLFEGNRADRQRFSGSVRRMNLCIRLQKTSEPLEHAAGYGSSRRKNALQAWQLGAMLDTPASHSIEKRRRAEGMRYLVLDYWPDDAARIDRTRFGEIHSGDDTRRLPYRVKKGKQGECRQVSFSRTNAVSIPQQKRLGHKILVRVDGAFGRPGAPGGKGYRGDGVRLRALGAREIRLRASLHHIFKGSTAPKPSRPHGHKCSNRLFRPAE